MHAPHNKKFFSWESGILSTIKTGSCKGLCQDSDWKRKIIRPLAAPLRLTAVTEFYFGKFFDFVTSSLHFTLTNLFHSIHWHHFALHSFTHPFNSITSLHTSALEWDRVFATKACETWIEIISPTVPQQHRIQSIRVISPFFSLLHRYDVCCSRRTVDQESSESTLHNSTISPNVPTQAQQDRFSLTQKCF